MDKVEITLYATLLVLSATTLLLLIGKLRRRRRLPSPPGPFPLPIIGHLHLLGPRLHQTFHDLSLRHGPIFHLRLGSATCAVVSSAALAKEALKTHDLAFSSRQNSTAVDVITYGGCSFAFSPYGPYWKYIKKLCTSQLLGPKNLRHFQTVRTSEVRSFLKVLMQKGTADRINLTAELLKLTSNVISVMMLSIRSSETEGEVAEAARRVFREVTEIFGEFDVADNIWLCKNFDFQGIRKRSKDIHRRYDALLEKIITDREELRRSHGGGGGGEARDILDMFLDIMESAESEVTFTRRHLKALILDFFTAGTDTTSIATEWAIAELINNPKILKKAQEEIDKVIGSNKLLQESDAPNLPYLQAIIKETFRLHPPIPMITRKSLSDCEINGYKISANTLLFVNNWSIGRNPKYWKTPLEFLPERFLEDENASNIDVKGQHFVLLPFGSGRRGCPGMMLALQELVLVIGTMIQCFDWKLPDGSGRVDMTERHGLATPRANDLICCVVPRVDPVVVFGP